MRITKKILIFPVLVVFSLCFVSCGGGENKKTEAVISDSLKTEIAASMDAYAAKINGGVIDTSQIFQLLQAFLDENPKVYGSALALVPVVSGNDTIRHSPYMYRSANGYVSLYLEKSYDYTKDQWFSVPVEQKKGYWSEPYYDAGGGNIWMITYSVPLLNPDGTVFGVITSDLEIKK
ncbi:MAG: cache domain-containing protein [Bacteroidales bacterium]